MQTTARPQLDPATATEELQDILRGRLASLIDASLMFKHAHWNVRGPGFSSAHELLDRVTDDLRGMADEIAERMRTLGGVPIGLAGAIASASPLPEYEVMAASVEQHFASLATTLADIGRGHRGTLPMVEKFDPVTLGLLTDQLQRIEFDAWLIASNLEPMATGDSK